MQRMLHAVLSVCLCLPVIIHSPRSSWSGPLHEAAMAEVDRGISITPSGDLDKAMIIFRNVEQLFPEEIEARGWAHYRISECLCAGGRHAEAKEEMVWAWNQIQKRSITHSDARFWMAFQYAVCLDRTGDEWNLAGVCQSVIDTYRELPEPGPGMENAYGWCLYWMSRCFLHKDQYAWAFQTAAEAHEIGNRVGNGTMASASVLIQARAKLGEKNYLHALSLLEKCAVYLPHENSEYGLMVKQTRSRVETALGLTGNTRFSVLGLLADPGQGSGWLVQIAADYARNAMQEGSFSEAIGVLAIAVAAYPHVPIWGERAGVLLGELAAKHSEDEYLELLRNLKERENPLENASLNILLANELAARGLYEEGRRACSRSLTASSDPRLSFALRLAEKANQGPRQQPDLLNIYEEEMTISGDRSRIEYLLKNVRGILEDKKEGATFSEWLEAHSSIIPREVYLLEKARWLRIKEGNEAGALSLVEELLAMGRGFEAHLENIICLFRLGRTEPAEEAVRRFMADYSDPSQYEYGLNLAAAGIGYDRAEAAISVLNRVLESRVNGTWYREALLQKGVFLWHSLHDVEGAVSVLQELCSLEPVEENRGWIVAEGHLWLARIYIEGSANLEAAEGLYRKLLENPEKMPLQQGEAFRDYARMLLERKNAPTEAIAVCEWGLESMPRNQGSMKEWLKAVRETARASMGQADPEEIKRLLSLEPGNEIRVYMRWHLPKEALQ